MPTCLPCSLRRENGFQPTHTQYTHHSLLLHHAGIMPPNPGVLGWHLLLLPPTTSDQLRSVFHHGPITAYHGTEMAVAQHCRCQRNGFNVPRCSTGPLQFSILRPSFEADPAGTEISQGNPAGNNWDPGPPNSRHSRYSRYSLEDLEMCCEVSPQCSAVNDLFTEYIILLIEYMYIYIYNYIHIYIILL